ncbi:MAG: hypothetical protein F6K19_19255 [Cyanothece sp. SIO1E1]|nr:hypothetical protein [Cyanothece sp. SIO1E1]
MANILQKLSSVTTQTVCLESSAIEDTVSAATLASFDLSGGFDQSGGKPLLAGGRFSGTFSYNLTAPDEVPDLPDFGRYELHSWKFDFFDADDSFVGTITSAKQTASTSTSVSNSRQVILVRPASIFLQIDDKLNSALGTSDWTLRLLFNFASKMIAPPADLAGATLVSGETRPILGASMPMLMGGRTAIANLSIRRRTDPKVTLAANAQPAGLSYSYQPAV